MAHLHSQRSDDDQLFQKQLDRAIENINALSREIEACGFCEHDEPNARVLGTGSPLADVMLVKWAPRASELDHGVAFYGRAGEAIRASVERLCVDPLDVYGTNSIKCSPEPSSCMYERCPEWLRREIEIVEPRLLVVMGKATLATVNELELDGCEPLGEEYGEIQNWSPTCQALYCPDIDQSLDRPATKREFWQAFRSLGEWYADKPPF